MKQLLRLLALTVAVAASANGETLTPRNLTPAGFGNAEQPQAAYSPSGEIYIVFGQKNSVYLTTSTDHGQTFTPPAKVADVPGLMLGMRRGPRIAASAHRIVILAPSASLKSFISDDNGKTWSPPLEVSNATTSSNEGLDNLTALPDGSFYAVWLDSRGDGKQVKGARLDPGTVSWGTNVTVYKSPEKSVCPCCHPSVIADTAGKLTVMWRNSLGGNRDLYLAESNDRGDTFSSATKLGTGSWKFNACPMDGGSLAATPNGVLTIWRRENTVYTDTPGAPESAMAQGAQPVIAQINGDTVIACQVRTDLALKRANDPAPVTISTGSYPSLATSPDGKEGLLVWDHLESGVAIPQFVILH